MCSTSSLTFCVVNLRGEELAGKCVLEVGAYDENGTLRPYVESRGPAELIGVDLHAGAGVDRICDAGQLLETFGQEAFDVVISTEMLEHVRDWRRVIHNLKGVCRKGGLLLITTRSKGFHYHAHPADHWRYEPEDIQRLFSDFEILQLETDPLRPGVFVKLRKPVGFVEREPDGLELYHIVAGRRVSDIDEATLRRFQRRYARTRCLVRLFTRIERGIFRLVRALVSCLP